VVPWQKPFQYDPSIRLSSQREATSDVEAREGLWTASWQKLFPPDVPNAQLHFSRIENQAGEDLEDLHAVS
jgi:hypothetical protein